MEMGRLLEDNERIVDVAFRASSGLNAPSGWSVVLVKTVLGKEYLHGINFPLIGKPTKKDVDAVVQKARAILDKEVSKRALIVTPEQARDISMVGRQGGILNRNNR